MINKVLIILGVLVIILFLLCMNNKELFTSSLNIFTNGLDNTNSDPLYKPLMTTSGEKLNDMENRIVNNTIRPKFVTNEVLESVARDLRTSELRLNIEWFFYGRWPY